MSSIFKAVLFFAMVNLSVLSAKASGDVLVTCAGLNQSSSSAVDWLASEVTAAGNKQSLNFPNGDSLLLTATAVGSDIYVTIQGGLFSLYRPNVPVKIKVSWGAGSAVQIHDGDKQFQQVGCYYQHDD